MPMLEEGNERPPNFVGVKEKRGRTVPRPVPSLQTQGSRSRKDVYGNGLTHNAIKA